MIYAAAGGRVTEVLSSPPLCRVCNNPMRCLSKEAQRWYCYKDDEVFYAKENRWNELHLVDPILIQVGRGREPTRKELIRYYGLTNIVWSLLVVAWSILILNLNSVLVELTFMVVFTGVVGNVIVAALGSHIKDRINWPPFWKSLRKPRDKYLVALSLWYLITIGAWVAISFVLWSRLH